MLQNKIVYRVVCTFTSQSQPSLTVKDDRILLSSLYDVLNVTRRETVHSRADAGISEGYGTGANFQFHPAPPFLPSLL